jgi:hypothetical protein
METSEERQIRSAYQVSAVHLLFCSPRENGQKARLKPASPIEKTTLTQGGNNHEKESRNCGHRHCRAVLLLYRSHVRADPD